MFRYKTTFQQDMTRLIYDLTDYYISSLLNLICNVLLLCSVLYLTVVVTLVSIFNNL